MGQSVEVEFLGAWDDIQTWLSSASDGNFIENFVEFAQEFGEEIREHLRKHILANDLNWAPLSPDTVKRKGHADPYIDKGFYLKNIVVDVNKIGKEAVLLRVMPEGTHPNGRSLQTIAEILERGSARIPARPLWRPVQNEMWNYSTIKRLNLFKMLGDI
jgi:hypothetical protein